MATFLASAASARVGDCRPLQAKAFGDELEADAGGTLHIEQRVPLCI